MADAEQSNFLTARGHESAMPRNLDRAILALRRRASDPLHGECLMPTSCANTIAEQPAPLLPSREWLRAADRFVATATLTLIRAPDDRELAAILIMVKRLADEHRRRLAAH